MASFKYGIRLLETDIFDNIKPRTMLRLAIDGVSRQSALEGAPFELLLEKKNAVWMLARLKYEQFLPVRGGSDIFVDITPRTIDGGIYYRVAEYHLPSGELAAQCLMASMAVDCSTRKILRAGDIDNLFSQPPREAPDLPMKRIRVKKKTLSPIGESYVRFGDCDLNGHLSAAAYADIVCEAQGYWEGSPKLCTELHLDFNAECAPGSRLALIGYNEGESFFMRGILEDGRPSFTAEGKFCAVNC